MRRAGAMFVLLALSGTAAAEFEDPPQAPTPTEDFWRDVIDPHAVEVDELVQKAQAAMNRADSSKSSDLDLGSQETRERVLVDVYNMMRYARRLSPRDPRVLVALGRAADELGRTRQAIEAFTMVTQLLGPEQAGGEATGRLGLIYLRQGQLDDAIRWLRIAQASPDRGDARSSDDLYGWNARHTQVHLATALALRGERHAAIEMLDRGDTRAAIYTGTRESLPQFALAVQLDRDDQRSAAFEILDRLQTGLQTAYATQIQNDLALFRFAPAEDAPYYLGLFYESIGAYTEARAAWALYAETGTPPFRRRALEHIAALDAQRRAPAPRGPGLRPIPPTRPRVHP
ncbi:MAG: hypothetical protein NT062_13390 [Proteobacteria bacterium]|nr:hypothetical protein [Pseudomonadota bacterium]